ncbi:hypothetical protein AB0D04_10815 [Streptomyces sp. NPDC048483]|uniref:hypothetical protein n=1 Tax=Streptomyces sp. NPDC048483 TaxID=3154927 RepID=UPI00342004C1
MGIESDQLVFDYLSRVGDLAQQRGLPAATRMQLVAGLRAEIDAHRADTVPGVKRMLARLGTPEALVTAAGNGEPRPPSAAAHRPSWRGGGPAGTVPAPRDGRSGPGPALPGFLRKGTRPGAGAAEPEPTPGAAPPHLAGLDELGDADDPPDWWRVEPGPYGSESAPYGLEAGGPEARGPEETVHGFVGGIEIPEIWERPEEDGEGDGPPGKAGAEPAGKPGGKPGAKPGAKPSLPRLVLRRAIGRRGGPAAEPGPEAGAGAGAEAEVEAGPGPGDEPEAVPVSLWAWLSPVVALAVVLLLAGAVVGSWIALGGGWALAYVSRRLSRRETKFAVLGVPGIAVGGLTVWLWGRFDGRWGDPVAPGSLGQALLEGLPGAARGAAVVSAGFLLWRVRRSL